MEAGRELDALVAEKVMGWHPKSVADFAGETYDLWEKPDGSVVSLWHIPEFSTDIAVAWQLLRFVRDTWLLSQRDRFARELQRAVSTDLGGGMLVAPLHLWFVVEPIHLCLAALKAAGVEVE
jgi:hypothetical protein